jgi:hypothetical protein
MQSLAEVENEDEPTAKQSDDEPATKQIEPDDNRHLIIAPPAQFETANSVSKNNKFKEVRLVN